MTAKTLEGALALEAASGRSRLSDAWRAGYAAALEAAARRIAPFGERPDDPEAANGWSVQHACADMVRSLDIPEAPHDR